MCLTWTCQTPDTPILPPLHPMAIGAIVGLSFMTVVFTLLLAGAAWKIQQRIRRRHHRALPDDEDELSPFNAGGPGNHPPIISKY